MLTRKNINEMDRETVIKWIKAHGVEEVGVERSTDDLRRILIDMIFYRGL